MKYDEYTCALLLVFDLLRAMRTRPTKLITSSFIHWPGARVAILPLVTFSIDGSDLLATGVRASASVAASAAAADIPRRLSRIGLSIAVTVLLSARGIVAPPSVLRWSCRAAAPDGRLLSKLTWAAVESP